jgi:hypothetical protein
MKGAAHTNTELLVTEDENVAKLHQLLGSRFTNHGQLLLPTFRQYEALSNDEGLQALAKDICRWLGYKPRSLHVMFGETAATAYFSVTTDTITINKQFMDHPLVTGGILAFAVTQFVMQHHHYTPNDKFIEVASIETGLGILIINALKPRLSRSEKFYHMLDGSWLQLEGLRLQSMTDGEYLRAFSIFATTHRLFPEDYGRSVTKRALHLLPSTPSTTKIIPLPDPSALISHQQNAKNLWIRICLLSATAAAIVLFGFILLSHPTKSVSFEQTRDSESLRIIKTSLNDCIEQASEQQSTYDPNDLFMTRQIDATKTRCESLRNQYNDALSLYESNYQKP